MTNNERSPVESIFDQSDDDSWVPKLSGKISEVFGTKWQVGGYNALDEIQRRVRLEAMSHHMIET